MAKDNKKLVQAITSQEENFAQWYTDICVKAELVEYSSVKGFIILRPYGQAIWELIQKDLDARFKATGHENVAMPVLMPESLLKKEGELVNGFAPEVAWVTMGGSEKLEERLAVRPTSETLFCDHWSRVLHSYRELPMKYNQWSQNMVSLVGRTARRSSSLSEPPIVTHATSGAKPLTSSPSFCSRLSGISTGIATFSWPVALKRASMSFWISSQMA